MVTVNAPTYAFTNQFPPLTVMGTAGKQLLLSLQMGGNKVLDSEVYTFDIDGMAVIRGLGDLLEKYFYEPNYDILRFAREAVLMFTSEGVTVNKSVTVYFCRSYVSGEKLEPEMLRAMPLTRAMSKVTVPDAKEYLPFISTAGRSVVCSIAYKLNGAMEIKTADVFTFAYNDTYQTVDVSATVMSGLLPSGAIPVYWDVYVSGHADRKVRYVLDKKGSFPPTSFVYQNCFGGVESFVCRGVRKDEITAERETAVMFGRAFISKQSTLRSYSVNTGTMDDDQKESLIDLLCSMSLMLLQDSMAIPVIVSGENVSLHNYRSKLPTAEFTFSHSARNLTLYKYNRSKGIFDYTFDYSFN